jgi:hypothetical protein
MVLKSMGGNSVDGNLGLIKPRALRELKNGYEVDFLGA